MNVLMIMIPMALLLGIGFVIAFMWATSKGQFDDLQTPAFRILNDDLSKDLTKEKLKPTGKDNS